MIFVIFLKSRSSNYYNAKNILPKYFNIFMKSFLYLIALPPFIVSIRFLISCHSSVYFFNTSLFFRVEAKTKYLFQLLSSKMYPSTLLKIRKRILNINVYMVKTFHCHIFNMININISTLT